MEKLGIRLNMSTAYHPQTDGQTERVNQCIEGYLRCMLFNQPKQWNRWLALAEFWYNTNFHTSLKTTTFEVLYGYAPPQLPLGTPPKSAVEAVNETLKERHNWIIELREQLRKAHNRMKRFADEKRTDRKFQVGDWVYLKLQPYRQLTVLTRKNQKLSPKYYGPFEILAKIGEVAYELKLPPETQIHPVFHVSQLKGRVSKAQAVTPSIPLNYPQLNPKENPEGILGRRLIKRNNVAVPQVLIKWKNQEEENSSWEDYEAIQKRFPGLILRDKDYFEGEGVSEENLNGLVAVRGIDQVKSARGEALEKGQAGQEMTAYGVSMIGGATGTSSDAGTNDSLKEQSLTLGPGKEPLIGANVVTEPLTDKSYRGS